MTWKTSTTVLAAGAVVAATAAIAGCGTTHSVVPGTALKQMTPAPSSAPSHQRRADADAAAILAAFAVPPGAVAVHGASGIPAGTLNSPASKPLTPDLVDDVSWWRVPRPPRAVLAWEKDHLSRRFSSPGSAVSMVGPAETWSEEFSLPSVPGVLTQRELQIQAVSGGNGQALVRVDALDTWLPAKPATDKVPSAATAVTITPEPGLDATGKSPAPVTVTDPSAVKRIVSLINGLSVFPRGAYSCPADTGQELRLKFRSGADGPVLAVATTSTGGCQVVSLVTGGKPQPGLAGGSTVVTKTLSIAGLHWPGY